MDVDKQQLLLLFGSQELDNELDLLFEHRMTYFLKKFILFL